MNADEGLDLGGTEGEEAVDPFAEVEADPLGDAPAEPLPEGKLGGDGETLEELEGAEDPGFVEEPADGAPSEEEVAEAEAAEAAAEPASAEPEPAAAERAEPEPTQTTEPEPEPGTKKAGTTERDYVVLLQDGNKEYTQPLDPIRAGNGEAALRAAYARLVPEGDESLTLIVVPKHFFNPKTVKAKVKSDRAIEIA